MTNTFRNHCLVTNNSDLEDLYTYTNFPVFIGCTDQPYSSDKYNDLIIKISRSSGIIQLTELLPLDLVYSGYHSEALGDVWKNHHVEFSEFIQENLLGDSVTEIGGSNCKLAEMVLSKNEPLTWTIVEPNLTLSKHNKIKLYRSFIEERLDLVSSTENIVHSHVLEHFYDPLSVIRKISIEQNEGKRMIFSIPNLLEYLKSNFVNTLNFEHTYFLTEELINYIFVSNNYRLLRKKYYRNHSIFYAFEKCTNKNKCDITLENKYNRNKSLYIGMINHYQDEIRLLNTKISKLDTEVFIFGAHIFSQYLLHMGLDSSKILSIIDNSDEKMEKDFMVVI